MSILQYETYIKMLKTSQDEYKLETLRLQRKFLYSLHNHHQLWASHTEDAETARYHVEIAELLHKLIEQYDQLLGKNYLKTLVPDS